MLSFQVYRPSPQFNCHEMCVQHYLSCGSFNIPFRINSLHQCSKYKINPFTKFTNIVKKQNKDSIFIILSGEGKFDVVNPVQVSATQKPFQFVRISIDSSEQLTEKKNDNELIKTQKWCIKKYELKQNSDVLINSKNKNNCFLLLLSGDLSIKGKSQSLTEAEAIYLTQQTSIKANKLSNIITIQIVK